MVAQAAFAINVITVAPCWLLINHTMCYGEVKSIIGKGKHGGHIPAPCLAGGFDMLLPYLVVL